MKLNKYIAHSGLCSRRKAAELVKAGDIKVNGEVNINPATEISESDIVTYDDKDLAVEEEKVYLLMNKPKNVVTTLSDERDRTTVLDIIRGEKITQRIYPVGRLDRNTTGLLLLTNDGDLAKKLSHPSHKVKKIYEVTLDKEVSDEDVERIARGLKLDDGIAPVDGVSHIKGMSKNLVGIEIHIGRNRIVRRIFEHLGYEVIKLDRVYYAGLTKKDLPRGWNRRLTEQEIIMLKHFI